MPPRGYWFAIVLVTSTAYLTTSVHAFQRARSGISMPWESRRCKKLQCRASGFVQSLESQPLSGLVLELAYDPTIAQEKNGRPFGIESLREIQLSKREVLPALYQGREAFATEEWKDFLIRSIGME